MKPVTVAVLSDIHGNYHALQATVEDALRRGAEEFLFLGDYVGEFPDPKRVLMFIADLGKQYPTVVLRGNREENQLLQRGEDQGWERGNSCSGALLYNYERLTTEDLDYFESLPFTCVYEKHGYPSITLCHGTPLRAKQKMLPGMRQEAEAASTALILCGHTHMPTCFTVGRKTIWNPGSIGIPEKKSKAQYMILTGRDGFWRPTWLEVDYDREATIKELLSSDLMEYAPYWCEATAAILRHGIVSQGHVLGRAMAIARKEYGYCEWPKIPDDCWEKAIEMAIHDRKHHENTVI